MLKQQKEIACQICKKPKKRSEVIPAELVRAPLVALIKKAYPNWSSDILEEEWRKHYLRLNLGHIYYF